MVENHPAIQTFFSQASKLFEQNHANMKYSSLMIYFMTVANSTLFYERERYLNIVIHVIIHFPCDHHSP
jgi:hypothetical protein